MITGKMLLTLCYVVFVVIAGAACAVISVCKWMCRQADKHAAKNQMNSKETTLPTNY